MTVTTKTLRLIIIYFIASLLTLGGYVYTEHISEQKYEREINQNYSHAFSELSISMSKISDSMQKVRYATSPAMVASLCAEIYSECSAASMALGVLPDSNIELEHTASFIAKAGDYAFYLMKNAVSGKARTNEESENLNYFAHGARQISDEMSKLQAAFLSGEISEYSFKNAQHIVDQKHDSAEIISPISSVYQNFENEFSEMPVLIYDGPFSESVEKSEAKLLKNKKRITEKEALEIASQYSGADINSLNVEYTVDSAIPIYTLAGKANENILSFEITVQGGYVLTYNNNRTVSESAIKTEDALNISANYLEQLGFEQMRITYWEKSENELTANYAYIENDTVCYPDLIKVSVALDNGEIIGFDALNYISNHANRAAPSSVITQDAAKEIISKDLNVEAVAKAIIPTSGKNEIFCYEFKCTDKENTTLLVYVNASTGIEEKILILIENENGTLTI